MVSQIKYNIHTNRRNAQLHSGVAWISRDHTGMVCHHARGSQTGSPDRLTYQSHCDSYTTTSMEDSRLISKGTCNSWIYHLSGYSINGPKAIAHIHVSSGEAMTITMGARTPIVL